MNRLEQILSDTAWLAEFEKRLEALELAEDATPQEAEAYDTALAEFRAAVAANTERRDDLLDYLAAKVRETTADAETCAEEAARMAARRKMWERQAQARREAIRSILELMPGNKAKTALTTAWLQSSGRPRLVTPEDAAALPPGYRIESTVWKPAGEAIRAAIEAGETVPGCRILPPTISVRIK